MWLVKVPMSTNFLKEIMALRMIYCSTFPFMEHLYLKKFISFNNIRCVLNDVKVKGFSLQNLKSQNDMFVHF